MRKPLSEHEATLRARGKDRSGGDPDDGRALQPVEGGRVRRIVFDDEHGADAPAQPEEPDVEERVERTVTRERLTRFEEISRPEGKYRPKRATSIEEIQRAVDRLKRGPFESTRSARHERVVYETPRGTVERTTYTVPEGERRAIHITTRTSSGLKHRRFVASEVERAVADVPTAPVVVRDAPADEEWRRPPEPVKFLEASRAPAAQHEAPRPIRKKRRRSRKGKVGTATARKAAKRRAATTASTTKARSSKRASKTVKRTAKGTGRTAKRTGRSGKRARRSAKKVPAGPHQCHAITAAGFQCRNTAMGGQAYCGAHKGHRPVSFAQVQKRQDTKPSVGKAKDTKPVKGTRKTAAGYQAQCAAVGANGKQCRNSSRGGSKYCAAHRNFRHGTPKAHKRRLDTAPRNPKAKDTKPKLRRKRSRRSK